MQEGTRPTSFTSLSPLRRRLGSVLRILLRGLLPILPLLVTIYVVIWAATAMETALAGVIQAVTPESLERFYIPGMGLLLGLVLVFLLGLLINAWVVRLVLGYLEKQLQQIPLIKTLYNAVRDFLGLFSSSKAPQPGKVVTVELGNTGIKLMGFVTRENLQDLPGVGGPDSIAVYLPMSYQIGGFMAVLPRSQVQSVDMEMEQAMRLVLTAGASTSGADAEKAAALKATAAEKAN